MTDKVKKRKEEIKGVTVFQRIVIGVAVVIVSLSVFISVHYADWEHFSRAGSLLIVLGIYVTLKDLSGDIYERSRNDYFKMSEFLSIGDISDFEADEKEKLIKEFQEIEKVKSLDRSISRYASKKYRNLEAGFLIGGTIIWGYGSWVLELVWPLQT